MKNSIDFQLITFFLCLIFATIGVGTYATLGEAYIPLWMASFVCLVLTYGIDLIDRIATVEECNPDDCFFECSECRYCPTHFKDLAD